MIKQTISHYRIIQKLGAGGMGEVYLAEDTKLYRAAALHHGNIAHVYEIGEANGKSFIAMEYVEGQTLDSKIKERLLDTDEIVRIGSEIADALNEAHSKSITHRDIKPSNISI